MGWAPSCGLLLLLQVMSFMAEPQATFLDYIQTGTEISFIVAVDFTASNGDPRNPASKHYSAAGPTQYENAVMGVGQVLDFYDTDHLYPSFGFGGTYRGSPTNHCFSLNGHPEGICLGIPGILQAYRQAISTWQLSGPTLFAPIIRMASHVASQSVGQLPPKYTVLLILTDGAIMDMEETINAVIDASAQPMSILIVGIGNDDFGNMHALDSDKKMLSLRGRTARRDIVQFVEFNRMAGDGARLAQELLAELPGQLLQYMKANNVPCPHRPPMVPGSSAAPPPGAGPYPGAAAPPMAGPPPPPAGPYPGAPTPPAASIGYPVPAPPAAFAPPPAGK